mgnify:CR=1 FL=1
MPQSILVVEDEWHIRKLTTMALKSRGYKVVEAENGVEAIEQLHHHPVDLVLTDWMMPGMDGRDLVQKIRERPEGKGLPVVVFSGINPPLESVEDELLDIRCWLSKPCRIQKIVEMVSSVLDHPLRQAIH